VPPATQSCEALVTVNVGLTVEHEVKNGMVEIDKRLKAKEPPKY
jgi:hypothetical protein